MNQYHFDFLHECLRNERHGYSQWQEWKEDLSRRGYEIDLREAVLPRIEILAWDLDGVDFVGANLRASTLYGCSLRGTKFCYADLAEADLMSAEIRSACFLGANLFRANLRQCHELTAHQLARAGGFSQVTGVPSELYDEAVLIQRGKTFGSQQPRWFRKEEKRWQEAREELIDQRNAWRCTAYTAFRS